MLLSVQSITKLFPVQRSLLGNPTAFVQALGRVSLHVNGGEIVGVVGESGCGKSTLGRCLVGLQEATEGKVWWHDRDIAALGKEEKRTLRRKFQMVFQNPFSSLDPRVKIGDVLKEPMDIHDLEARSAQEDLVAELLGKVGLSREDARKFPHEFSGGQRQRVGLARALACRPDLIVLDEPVSSLDVSVQASILNLLKQLNQQMKVSYFFISHDLQVVGFLSHRVLVMYLGKIVEEGESRQVLGSPRHPYTRALLAASEGSGKAVGGEPPSPTQIPSGCAFHTRCPFAEDRCRAQQQELLDLPGGGRVACWKWKEI